ncbi:hypothetical protein JRQ81_000584 [Phrynocephalus forsythii]|uniref:Mos1 transposase HTH domain-containing protein n=1 Tax=Phrynocephalus forsythii TaxID=171643 RepID=A0A9Q0Y8B8_9SAUR|nr:hypothetical protein JRQ81_000584 [Phrynocephalus forsythii]
MMNKIKARSVIKFLHLKGNNIHQIHDKMKAVYGHESPSYYTVVRWKRNFQSGHMPLTDEPRAGRPSIKDDQGEKRGGCYPRRQKINHGKSDGGDWTKLRNCMEDYS